MVRRLQREEARTNRKLDHLMERVREIRCPGEPGSPLSSVASEPESPCDRGQVEQCDSPTTQLHEQMVHNIESQFRSHNRLTKALLRIVSLDTAFRQFAEPQQSVAAEDAGVRHGAETPGDGDSGPLCGGARPWRDDDAVTGDATALEAAHRRSSARRPSAQQPEEEDEALSLPDAGVAQKIAEKMAPDEGHERGDVSMSRHSHATCSSDDPEREPQPKESPKDEDDEDEEEPASLRCVFHVGPGAAALEDPAAEPDDEPTLAAIEGPDEPGTPQPAGDGGLQADEGDVEAEASAIESSSEAETGGTEVADPTDDSFEVGNLPRPGEEGMPRSETYLHQLEQSEMQKQVSVVVPEGMADNRLVSFVYENKRHDVRIPEAYSVGQEVTIFVPKRPPLERNPAQAFCRGHAGFPDRLIATEPLKHSPRCRHPCSLDDPEFRHRRQLYSLLRGTNMVPLLPFTPEEPEYEESDGDQPTAVI